MSTSQSPASAVSHRQKRISNERQNRKQRSQRATWACERCRMKKLRCTGGHPCSTCERAGVECDFGDRYDDNLSISNTNQRLAQLEKVVADLVAVTQSTACLSSNIPPSAQQLAGTAAESSDGTPLAQGQENTTTPGRMNGSVTAPSPQEEGLDSRWAALQHNAAPFPPLMAHPTVWSGEPGRIHADGNPTAQFALGVTHYAAKVDLRSEPIVNGIVSESLGRSLFTLFFQKCHPSFPILEICEDLNGHFDHLRSSSPFLFTVILSIAGRYYTSHRVTQSATSSMLTITRSALESLADLACAHLGFVIFRKQHQLSDVQATLLLSVWIPRGHGQSADQWMVTGICTRLAYRIGMPESLSRPAIVAYLNAGNLDIIDIREVNDILRQWHTWLIINQYDTALSLGFGRPHVPAPIVGVRDYLNIVRKLGSSSVVDLTAATYVTSLAELTTISSELISGLRVERLRATPRQYEDSTPLAATAWSRISVLLSKMNPRMDEWERQWTWNGSYDAISLGEYSTLCKIYGEHIRLCLNSLSLNLLANNGGDRAREIHVILPYLARACESAVTIVQDYVQQHGRVEPIIRYGADYFVLILGQAAVFLIRALVARLEQPLPVDRLVLEHYLKIAVEHLKSNDFATTNFCTWLARLIRALARHTGVAISESGAREVNLTPRYASWPELEWDFDISSPTGQIIFSEEPDLNLGYYFDFAQPYYPAPPPGLG